MGQLVGSDLKAMVVAGARLLENSKEVINAIDTFRFGWRYRHNMCLTMRSALNEVLKVNEDTVSAVGNALATGSLWAPVVTLVLFYRKFSAALPKD